MDVYRACECISINQGFGFGSEYIMYKAMEALGFSL